MHADDPFIGSGEMRARCRALDWSATPLGAVDEWPPELCTVVRMALDSPFPINLWCGPELVLIYNDAYRPLLGAKHPHALGCAGPEVWSEIWPHIQDMFVQIAAGGPAIYAADAPFTVHRSAADVGDAPNAWFTFSLSAVRDASSAIVAYLNIVSETTPRILAEHALERARAKAEHAEARLREVFAQAPAFLAVLRGDDHVFEYVNAAYYQLVGHRELVGRSVWDALPEVRGQGFEALLRNVMVTGVPYVGREVPVVVSRTPESEPEQRFVDLVYYPLTEPDGTRSGLVAHGSDVTEHVLARQEAQRARDEAEHASQAKSQFLANMSHEIRTPINAVIGYTDLLDAQLAGPLTERQQEFVDRIRSSSRHLLSLVNDVLDLSKIEAGEMMVEREPTRADAVISAALQMVAPQAETHGLTLTHEECTPGLCFAGDEDRARQIVLNLLSNALKFTPAGGHVRIACRSADALPAEAVALNGGPWVVIDVEDDGPGIPPGERGRIFEAFVQVDAGRTRRAGGTGLGLTISRRLARLMGGDLTLRTELGAGSCFSLWLPAESGHGAAARTPTAAEVGFALGVIRPAAAVGQLLLEAAELLEEELVWRLREKQPHSRDATDRSIIADHTASFLAAIGRSIIAVDNENAAALLEDGDEIRAVLASRHGRQRRRLGWQRTDVEEEYAILHDIVDNYLRREAAQRTAADVDATIQLVHEFVDRARAHSLASWEQG